MQLIRCTKKLQKEMGLKAVELSTAETDNSRLGEWYANLIYIERRKCVVFVNKKTLFNFIAPNVSRDQIRDLDNLFLLYFVNEVLIGLRLDLIVPTVLDEYQNIQYAATNNRSILGSLNDMIMNYRYYIDFEGGLFKFDYLEIVKKVNDIPFRALKSTIPIRAFKAVYGL